MLGTKLKQSMYRWDYGNVFHGVLICLMFLIFGWLVCSCSACRDIAINDAEKYQTQGKEVRIAAYCVGMDGKIAGLGLWTSHVQAQVKVDDKWLWVNTSGGLSETTTYSIRPMPLENGRYENYLWWTLDTYKDMLARKDEIKKESKNPCGDRSWWAIALIGLIIL